MFDTSKRNSFIPKIVFFGCWLVLASAPGVWSDVIQTTKGIIEGRVLEDSSQVLILETVAGEYIVIDKGSIRSTKKEAVPDFYFRRGRFYEQKGQENQALLNYLEALNLDPNHAASKQQVETIKYQQKKSQWDKELSKAQEHLDAQEYRQALESFQQVLNMEPEDRLAEQVVKRMSDTHTQIAYLFYNHCSDQDAILELAKAEELNPESADIYFVLARIHESNNMLDQARLEYERALELNPSHENARTNLEQLIDRTRNRFGSAREESRSRST